MFGPGKETAAKEISGSGLRFPWTSIFPLVFGLALLAFLTAIERESWFHIKPASGTAKAMAFAAEPAARK